MTLAVDAPPLFPQALPDLPRQVDNRTCLQIYLLCVAKGTNDASTIRQLDEAGCKDLTSSSVDVHHPRYELLRPKRRPEKRRRTAFNSLHQASPAPPVHDSSLGAYDLPETKRFNGVRYRPDRKTWTAEMKPPKYKNKVFFGEFKSQALAARVVDAAFYHYSKPHLLNFQDSPQILLSSSTAAALLGEEEKLGFVKEQAKWLASIASSLPSPNPNRPSALRFQEAAAALESFAYSPTGIQDKVSFKLSSKLSSKLPSKLPSYVSNSSLASHAL